MLGVQLLSWVGVWPGRAATASLPPCKASSHIRSSGLRARSSRWCSASALVSRGAYFPEDVLQFLDLCLDTFRVVACNCVAALLNEFIAIIGLFPSYVVRDVVVY